MSGRVIFLAEMYVFKSHNQNPNYCQQSQGLTLLENRFVVVFTDIENYIQQKKKLSRAMSVRF